MLTHNQDRVARLFPGIDVFVPSANVVIVADRMRDAITMTARRGRANDWTYYPAKHAAMIRAYHDYCHVNEVVPWA